LTRSVDSGLTRAKIEVLRIDLRHELDQLRRDLRQLWPTNVKSESAWISGDAHAGRADQAESEVRDRMRARCAQIVAALDRIRRGTYGRCSVCSRKIPYERLVVTPVANACKRCNVLDSWLNPDTSWIGE